MKTDTLNQHSSPTQQLHESPSSLEALFNAPNPNDTALVPASDTASTQASTSSTHPPIQPSAHPSLAHHPLIHSSNHPSGTRMPRNGKIARLPKPVRDIVNRMLFQHIPQERIAEALDEIGIHVTQRNISNWKTHGGYREWRLAQEHAIQLHVHQDNLIDLIRRHDGSELPEVGLQAAATQLSQFFLTPAAGQLLASDPKAYDLRVATLARISAQLKALQKYRDDCIKNVSFRDDPARIRRNTTAELEKLRQGWSSEVSDGPNDPNIPHRNELPNQAELFRLEPPKPPPLFPTLAEFKELLRSNRAAAQKAQLNDGGQERGEMRPV